MITSHRWKFIYLSHLLNPIWPSVLGDILSVNLLKSKIMNLLVYLTNFTVHQRNQRNNRRCTILQQNCAQLGYKLVQCGIWDWCIVGFVQHVDWFTQHLFLVSKSEMVDIKKIMDRENLYHWSKNLILIISKMKCTFLRAKLSKMTETTQHFSIVFLSSILCKPVGIPYSTNWGM